MGNLADAKDSLERMTHQRSKANTQLKDQRQRERDQIKEELRKSKDLLILNISNQPEAMKSMNGKGMKQDHEQVRNSFWEKEAKMIDVQF